MSKYSGRLVKLAVNIEGTRGSNPASYAFQVPRTSFSFDDKVTKARSNAGMGVLADSEEAFVTTKYGAGDLEGEVRADSFGVFLYGILGTLSTSGPVDSAYTHAFSVTNDAINQSLSFLVEDKNTKEAYPLVMIDTLEISAELDAVVRFNVSLMSKQGETSGVAMPALASSHKFTKKHLSFKIAASIGAIAGASAISLKSLNITFSKGVVLDDVLGTAEPEDLFNTILGIEGSFELNYNDETYKGYVKDGTNRAMEIKWTNSDATIGAGTNPSLTMQFPKVDFFDWEPNYALDEIVTQTVSFKASRDVANGLAVISKCELVNDTASY